MNDTLKGHRQSANNSPVTGATSYNYYVDGVLGGAIANGGTIAYNSLAAGNHSIQGTAVNAGGESALSSEQYITIEGDAPSETSSEEGSQGVDYDGLTWTQVGTSDYYVASIHGTVKNAFPIALAEMQGNNETIHIVPGVSEGTAPIWPAFTDVTLNGVANAASVDGAGRFRKMWHITLPGIKPTIVVLLIMSLGNILGGGFDRPFAFQNNLVMRVADVIATFVYRVGIKGLQFSLTTAVGLFQSVVGIFFLLMANFISRKLGERGIW